MLKLLSKLTSFIMGATVVPETPIPEKHHHYSIMYNTAHHTVGIVYTGIEGQEKITEHILNNAGIRNAPDLYAKLSAEINEPGRGDVVVELVHKDVKHVINLDKRKIFIY